MCSAGASNWFAKFWIRPYWLGASAIDEEPRDFLLKGSVAVFGERQIKGGVIDSLWKHQRRSRKKGA